VLGILSQICGMSLPRKWFNHNAFPFRTYSWEKDGKVYDLLKIRGWKTKLPDVSRVIKKMAPKQIKGRPDKETLEKMLAETCVAELIHGLLMVFGWGCAFVWHGIGGVTVSIIYMIGNVPFIMIQRYNRPRHRALLAKQEKTYFTTENGGSYESAK